VINRSKRILIVEDEAHVAYLMYHSLSKLLNKGYQIDTCLLGDDARTMMQVESYRLVITDLCMPGMHGLDLIHHVREQYPQSRILAVTAYGSHDMENMVRRLGAEYLTKPFDPLSFVAVVARILEEPDPGVPEEVTGA
jgi:DNA-binding response OmpR family regulator